MTLVRTWWRKDVEAGYQPWGSHRSRTTQRTTHPLGMVLALALLATACASPSASPLAPGAAAEKPGSVAASRPTVLLDPAPEQAEPGGSFLPAGGSDPAAEPSVGFQSDSSVALEDSHPALAAAGDPSGQTPSLAGAPEAAESTASSAAIAAVQPTAPAPRRVNTAAAPPVTARYVAVLDEASGELLHGQDEHARVAPASVTKIATTLVALEREPDLDRRIPVTVSGSAMAARDHSSIMGLEPGRQVPLRTLLYGMMLPSGNDAAEQVALALGGSRENYVDWMNQRVAELGLQDTHFVTPSGMDADGHYSSAYDMAWLGRAAMQNETFRQLAGAASYRGDGYSMTNLNRLIGVYPGADGIKIGLTRAAGRTIVASARRDGHRVYVSLMRSQNLPGDSTLLFDWVWRTFEW